MTQRRALQEDTKIYVIGGGIASLAAAAFLIRDAGLKGHNIIILEDSERIGGSLDANGTPEAGYVMRGGRMIESKYLCTFDLFSSIPTMDNSQSVTEEIFAWNKTMKTSSKSRLFRNGKSVDAPLFGLSESHILTIERLGVEPESLLGRTTISDQFEPDFFETDFWFMWCTTFAFQPWHSAVEFKRYLVRFTHMVSGFSTLGGIMRTVYNQYDSLVRPLQRWLEERGVQVSLNTKVLDLVTVNDSHGFAVEQIVCERGGHPEPIHLSPSDFVIATLGSMTEGSSFGGMDQAATLNPRADGGAWSLWKKISAREPECGKPTNFSNNTENSKWLSFTTTLRSPNFFTSIRDLTGNAPGEGGLITFPESNWLTSIVLPHQPHFLGQPDDVNVFWGYGLFVDQPGNFVKKPMAECTGREIMTEIMGHLHLGEQAAAVLSKSTCIPCMMPFITSQFLPRSAGDRPAVLPERSKNLAFIGQFCELEDDVVFTVEYSVRSAQTAVYGLLGIDRKPHPVYKGNHDPRVLLKAFLTLHGKRDREALLEPPKSI
ncbi:oleate hydratase [Granulicella tundricola]|uniref:67 kDa myosin-cross-reactive antigen family protein n=1 Tax=Granulicella tundricola (strain ATCC BAA-1859 / DSM 23138 / MP5ACTX9) TaxID=1198114 RepID=E8X7D3_GRATM|nr:oleate hydratase [Granulicella tundricola]ADW71367.1 67 kDa myosin-cross-reactive antigen family protein [Granulicella tundricola MP5ACTX9]